MTPPAQKHGRGDDRGHVAALFAAELERLADENRRLYEHIGRVAHAAWLEEEAARDREQAEEFRNQFERAAHADEEARAEAKRRRKEQARRAAEAAEEERLREERRKRTEAAARAARERARQAAEEAERLSREWEERMRREKEEKEARERARKAEEERLRREEEERARREKAERETRERAEAERLRREEEERRRQEQARKEAREREARRRAAEAERVRRAEEQRQRAASALEKYDHTWKTITAGNILTPLTWAKFPWPMSTIPSCHHEQEFTAGEMETFLLSTLQTNAEKCKAIRKELARWHPDKINIRVLMQIAAEDVWRVKAAAVCVTRVLISLLERFNKA
ncbi:hypothetical protein AURDEDRAFT_125954 [Auricularia subglabra TFB-10046 SS5]|nr:hypothetical protein AURDEDRAFT_125954 [Auricularia subglabra TFB-10046 SS5]